MHTCIFCFIDPFFLNHAILDWSPSRKANLVIVVVELVLQAGCSSCCPTNSIKALKYDCDSDCANIMVLYTTYYHIYMSIYDTSMFHSQRLDAVNDEAGHKLNVPSKFQKQVSTQIARKKQTAKSTAV